MQDEEKIKLRGIPVYIFCLFMQNGLHNGLVLIATDTLHWWLLSSYLFKIFCAIWPWNQSQFSDLTKLSTVKSRVVDWSTIQVCAQMSQYIIIKFPLHNILKILGVLLTKTIYCLWLLVVDKRWAHFLKMKYFTLIIESLQVFRRLLIIWVCLTMI